VWKIEGLDRREECERIVGAARRDGRTTVGVAVAQIAKCFRKWATIFGHVSVC
jgi:hypothetical protein